MQQQQQQQHIISIEMFACEKLPLMSLNLVPKCEEWMFIFWCSHDHIPIFHMITAHSSCIVHVEGLCSGRNKCHPLASCHNFDLSFQDIWRNLLRWYICVCLKFVCLWYLWVALQRIVESLGFVSRENNQSFDSSSLFCMSMHSCQSSLWHYWLTYGYSGPKNCGFL